MQEIAIRNLEKYIGERKLFSIGKLDINSGEVVGIVGNNGSGKTTLFNILCGITDYDSGFVEVKKEITYIKQFEDERYVESYLSGGEKTRKIINTKIRDSKNILFIDEPTNNLDMQSIDKLIIKLKQYTGTMCIISHDRNLLDQLCSHIIEIDNGNVTKYVGNYTQYIKQKNEKKEREKFEYIQYIQEKNRLENSIAVSRNSSKKMKKHPSRMGNSEARLDKRKVNEIKEKLEGHTKALERRLEKLEVKDKPIYDDVPKMSMEYINPVVSKVAISVENLNILLDNKMIFKDVNVRLKTGSKTAIIGDNGAGKTTFIKYILSKASNVNINNNVKIGYFSQDLDVLDYNKNIFDNVMQNSIQNETIVRNILARLLFKQDDIYKNVCILSGGEKVKVILAKIFVSDSNLLILDEPTNFLDTNSLIALEQLLKEYEGTVLFTSHDRALVDNVATDILIIQDEDMMEYNGNYSSYINNEEYRKKQTDIQSSLELEFKITSVLSRLSITKDEKQKEELEEEYNRLIQLKNMEKYNR